MTANSGMGASRSPVYMLRSFNPHIQERISMAPRHRMVWKHAQDTKPIYGTWFPKSFDLSKYVPKMNASCPHWQFWIETEPSWSEVDTSTEDTEIVE